MVMSSHLSRQRIFCFYLVTAATAPTLVSSSSPFSEDDSIVWKDLHSSSSMISSTSITLLCEIILSGSRCGAMPRVSVQILPTARGPRILLYKIIWILS
eukprot:scaffold18_cov122-Cylindrotheca_fusiformis.AAC.2